MQEVERQNDSHRCRSPMLSMHLCMCGNDTVVVPVQQACMLSSYAGSSYSPSITVSLHRAKSKQRRPGGDVPIWPKSKIFSRGGQREYLIVHLVTVWICCHLIGNARQLRDIYLQCTLNLTSIVKPAGLHACCQGAAKPGSLQRPSAQR